MKWKIRNVGFDRDLDRVLLGVSMNQIDYEALKKLIMKDYEALKKLVHQDFQ